MNLIFINSVLKTWYNTVVYNHRDIIRLHEYFNAKRFNRFSHSNNEIRELLYFHVKCFAKIEIIYSRLGSDSTMLSRKSWGVMYNCPLYSTDANFMNLFSLVVSFTAFCVSLSFYKTFVPSPSSSNYEFLFLDIYRHREKIFSASKILNFKFKILFRENWSKDRERKF